MDGEQISEIGWSVLPEFQGQGIAKRAVASVIDKAIRDGRWGATLHAFPAISNIPSNAICKGLGFELLAERELIWSGALLKCNHWTFRLDANVSS
jgi:RimJ/RimL family protein N-acetyltransferase